MKVAVIHYQPLEKYPPAINFLKFLDQQNFSAKAWSTQLDASYNIFDTKTIKIKRLAGIKNNENLITRLIKYFNFNISVFFNLLTYRPDRIIYFETLSAFPALLYKKLVPRKVKIFVHYHEYTSPEEYKSGMFIGRALHQLEKKMYDHFEWISHTNEMRGVLFKNDIRRNDLDIKIVPNYPPLKWKEFRKKNTNTTIPVKMVYVGALSTETMYMREICDWVIMQNGNVQLDFWSQNISESADNYFRKNNSPWISLKGGIDYEKLPVVLSEYDIGLILYKGHIPNYIHNAPNKLYEYLICGLDVLFPEELKGTYPFICETSAPRVLKINFNQLNSMKINSLLISTTLRRREVNYFAEDVYGFLVKNLKM